MPVRPFTLAFRALHYGRYGKSAEDARMWPMYIGYWDLVRGYESFNFGNQEELSEFDINRLYGSKMIIANAEIRFPLFRVLGIGKGYYGPFPIEAFGFYDWGLAWDSTDKAVLPRRRDPEAGHERRVRREDQPLRLSDHRAELCLPVPAAGSRAGTSS